ncbi:MAG: hypothetical protein K2M41_02255 [Muribaculaceae bacterium]|nr:hypothetical protein [Muribaculaceae bacterium]
MSCYFEMNESALQAVLGFKRDQLLYDIRNYAYIEGSVMDTQNEHNRHTVQDIGETGNIDRVNRVLDLAIAKCRETLYPYTKHTVINPVLDDKLREPGVYGIVLNVPTTFSQTTLILLEKLIHEYLVCEAVADWMSITNPVKMETWKSKAEDALNEIRVNINTRISRTRRRMHPF